MRNLYPLENILTVEVCGLPTVERFTYDDMPEGFFFDDTEEVEEIMGGFFHYDVSDVPPVADSHWHY